MKKIILFLPVLTTLTGTVSVQGSVIENGSHGIDPLVSTAVLQALDEYMTTFNAKDPKGREDAYQFPTTDWPAAKCRYWKGQACAIRQKYLANYKSKVGSIASGTIAISCRHLQIRCMLIPAFRGSGLMAA